MHDTRPISRQVFTTAYTYDMRFSRTPVFGMLGNCPVEYAVSPSKRFLPALLPASAGNSDRNVSVRLSVCLSVRHAPVLCQNEES